MEFRNYKHGALVETYAKDEYHDYGILVGVTRNPVNEPIFLVQFSKHPLTKTNKNPLGTPMHPANVRLVIPDER